MTAQEYEQFLHDAEVKLARLKALYEQWFQGIERTEPVIPRKDLDRTLELLKKNMPRNTALRFRTQQLSARYGTYGIYWGRIGRQIEEGTYKRILARVNRTSAPSTTAHKGEESGWEIDVDVDEVESGTPGKVDFSEGDLDAILGALATEEEKPKTKPARSLSPFGFGAGLASKPPGSAASGPSRPPAAAAPSITPAPAVTPAKPAAAVGTFGKPTDVGAKPVAPAAVTSTPAHAAPVGRPPASPAPAAPAPAPVTATMARPKDAAPPPVVPPIAKPPAPTAAAAPKPLVHPPASMAARPMGPPPVSAPLPMSRPAAPVAPPPSAPSGVRPAPTAPAARPAPAAISNGSSLDEQRMRAIHASYVDARRKNNEAADVRYETLAESVQKMIPKLREKHGGKPIDFEVVVQNGKVGLKPKVHG